MTTLLLRNQESAHSTNVNLLSRHLRIAEAARTSADSTAQQPRCITISLSADKADCQFHRICNFDMMACNYLAKMAIADFSTIFYYFGMAEQDIISDIFATYKVS